MCSGKILRFLECPHAEEQKTQCQYIEEDLGFGPYCLNIRWLTIIHEGEYRRYFPGRCVECREALKKAKDEKTAENMKTEDEKAGEEKAGEEKTEGDKNEGDKTEGEKTGEEKSDEMNVEGKKGVEGKEGRIKEVQDEIGFHF
jgi:hypothetical protein